MSDSTSGTPADNPQNIVLTGFMGTGKSTIGNMLAARLQRVFFDMDTAIEHRTGLTIPRIFAQYSEPFFRAIEKGICHELALQQHLVIATGGGALIDDDNRRIMQKTGVVVCLTATPETIEARLKQSDARPLAGRWRDLYNLRQPVYEQFAHRVDTTDKTPEHITEEILTLWQHESA
jgi:shikimate kinase